jgi:hypothetical protein
MNVLIAQRAIRKHKNTIAAARTIVVIESGGPPMAPG